MKSERILQKNLRALAKENPALAVEIERADNPEGWHIYEAKSGIATLEIEYQGKRLSVHSRYNPRKEVNDWLQSLPDDWDVLVVFGFGLGYHWEALSVRNEERPIIFIENEASHLKAALSSRDLVKVIRQVGLRIIIGSNPLGMAAQILKETVGKNIIFKALPAYENLYADYWQLFQQEAKDLLRQYRVNIATQERFGQQWLDNYVDNAREYYQAHPLNKFFGSFKDRPAIIVAAGPSLEKNVGLLNELKDKALIITAGSAIRALEKHGIKPHLIVSFDGSEANYKHFEDFVARDLPLVFMPTIYPRIIEEYTGPKICAEINTDLFVLWFDQQLGFNPGMLVSGPSVANVCLDLAVKLGANPIILTGQDLAFTGGKTHADGAKHQRTVDPNQPQYIMIDDVFGDKVPTDIPLYTMKVWFEQYLRALKGTKTVIDASEGGAFIEGTKISTLREVAEEFLTVDYYPQQILAQQLQHPVQSDLGAIAAKLQSEVDKLLEQVELIDTYYQESLLIASNLLSRVGKTKIDHIYREALKTYKRLDEQVGNLKFFQVFIKGDVESRVKAINLVLGSRLNEEQEPVLKLKRLITIYSAFFSEVFQRAQGVKGSLQRLRQLNFDEGCANTETPENLTIP